jgi:hypothetical protein
MKEFEIYLSDLNDDAKERYLEFIGGMDNVQDILPITTIEIEDEEFGE